MAVRGRFSEAHWLEPVLAAGLFVGCLVINAGERWPYVWVIDLVCCLGAAMAYRRPAASAIGVGAGVSSWLLISGVLPSVSGLAMLIVVVAAFRSDLSWKWPLVFGVVILGYLVLIAGSLDDTSLHWGTGALLSMLLGLAMGSGELWRRWQQLVQLERERAAAELEAFRVSLARDLHDTVAQTLSATAMRAHLALADPGLPSEPRIDLEWIADQCRSSAHDLRELMGRLRGEEAATDEPLASVATLGQTVAEQVERLRAAGFDASSEVTISRLSAARAKALSAVTVEAANNMIKHATPGTTCLIQLRDDGPDVLATYSNVAARSGGEGGMGLTGVRERLALLGGTSHSQRVGKQWQLVARLPHGIEASD